MKFKNIFLSGVLAVVFVSCSDDDNDPKESPYISFVSEAKAYSTRVGEEGNQWLAGDNLGFYMVATETYTALTNATNILYTTETGGSPVRFSSTSAFTYPKDGSKVDFIGYYPYSQEVSNFIYPVSLADQAAGSTSHDLMHATSRSGYSLISSKEVTMNFTHQLSKVIFKFVNSEGETVCPDQMLIKGMNTTAHFDLTTASLQNESTVVDITPYKTSGGSFEAIVMPFDIAPAHEIEYTVNDQLYTWSLSDVNTSLRAIETGYKYTFTITSPESGGESTGKVEVDDGSSVAPWEDGESAGGSAELVINYTLFPTNDAAGVYKDTYLTLTFAGDAPAIGTTGSIKVYRASDNTLVDVINMADTQDRFASGGTLHSKMDLIGVGNSYNSNRYRVVNYNPMTIDGNTAIIKLHYNRLEYNTKYYVLIDGKAIKHADFYGVKEASKWAFTTKAAPVVPTDAAHTVTVGSGHSTADFRTIQAAIDFLACNVAKDDQKTVYIQNGVYEEMLYLRGVNNFTIKGESKNGVIVRYNNYDGWNGGVGGGVTIDPNAEMGTTVSSGGGRCLFLIESVDKLRLESLTIENTHVKDGNGDQAETIYANNDNKAIAFVDCNLLSCQDTLNLKGYCWFYNSLIAGDVDFIWGSPGAALFENCEIRSVGNGYIVQARVSGGNKGFVFLNCELTTTGTATYMYLCRTTGNVSYFDNITFANCKMAEIYGTYGWGLKGGDSGTPPNPSEATAENGYKTYNCTNPEGGNLMIARSEYAYALTETEYLAHYSSRDIVLSGYTGGIGWFAE